MAAPEVSGFSRSGGLGDFVACLPKPLAELGHECAVIAPYYASTRRSDITIEATELTFTVRIKNRKVAGRLSKAKLPGCDVPVFLVQQPQYFERDNPNEGRGLYQFRQETGKFVDYPDNCERFVFFSRAILEAVRRFDYWPDILHLHDWQTGLVPVYLREEYAHLDDRESAGRYQQIKTFFTVHNIEYQGTFWHWDMLLAGLDWKLYNHHQLEFHGQMSLLKAGLVFADAIGTVSQEYAEQIQTEEHGHGLGGVLRERADRLFGITNGVDSESWARAAKEYARRFEQLCEQ